MHDLSQDLLRVNTTHDLDILKAKFLGQKSFVREQLMRLGKLPGPERAKQGKEIHALRQEIQAKIESKKQQLAQELVKAALQQQQVDTTRSVESMYSGSSHPLTVTQNRLLTIFSQLGFEQVQGPEMETAYYNFTALNTPKNHPAITSQDTLYIEDSDLLLRSHTSSVQIRTLEQHQPPLRIISPGRVFRADTPDATHSPCFMQCEGLVVDSHSSLVDLKMTLESALSSFFAQSIATRFRPSYFPFTEPSLECDIWFKDKWLELLGCGMVHPWVLANLGIDTDKYQGYAFGIGIDRLCMLHYGIEDIRDLYTGDSNFLAQFQSG